MKRIVSCTMCAIVSLAVYGCQTPGQSAPHGQSPSQVVRAKLEMRKAHTRFARVWERHVATDDLGFHGARATQGWLDYPGWAASEGSRQALDRYLEAAAAAEVDELDVPAKLTLYINAHNAAVVDSVLASGVSAENPSIPAPDSSRSVTIAGEEMTLGELREYVAHKAAFARPRASFGLLCVARGCHRAATSIPGPQSLHLWLDGVERDFLQQTTTFDGQTIVTSPFFAANRPAFAKAFGSLERYYTLYLQREQADLQRLQEMTGAEAKPRASAHQETFDALENASVNYRYEAVDWSPPADAFRTAR